MIGYQNSWLQFLRLLISWLWFGLVRNLKKSVAVTTNSRLSGRLSLIFFNKNQPFLLISRLRLAADVYLT